MEKITADNWTFTAYQAQDLTVILSFGASPALNDSKSPQELYFMTVMDKDGQDLYQEEFHDISEALVRVNLKYGHWEFQDRQVGSAADDGSCGTCAAH